MTTLPSSSSTLPLLAQFGPQAPPAPPPSAADSLAYCRRIAHSRQENFPVLTRLLHPALVDPFAAVYSFCRWADDLADERLPEQASEDPEAQRGRALTLLAWWRCQTEAWHRGDPPTHPVFVALASIARQLHVPLPLDPFLDLIDAFEQDQRVSRYETWDELLRYCARSANPVGRLVLCLGGVPDTGAASDLGMPSPRRGVLERSDALCTALQLTNFWQDVRRDLLDRDRVYLPQDLAGLDAATLRDFLTRPNDPAARVPYILALRPLIERTRALFDESRDLWSLVPDEISAPVWMFHSGGLATLRRIEAIGCATLWSRPALTRTAKLLLVSCAWLRTKRARKMDP